MPQHDIDFEGANNTVGDVNNDTNTDALDNKEDVTHLNGNDVDDITNGSTDDNKDKSDDTGDNNNDHKDDNPSTGELNVGDQLEVDGITYTVAKNGDLVDDKGNIFKEAKDVKEWLKSVEVSDDNESNTLSLSSIQNELGITITDEKGNVVEFEETPAGVKVYIDSVMELRSNELQTAAINRLYQENPYLKEFNDYVKLTGSYRGFGEIPDRSGIRLDKDNDAQLEAVIRMAAEEFGNKSINSNYIAYLKSSGSLYDEAKNQLDALVEKDKAYRKDIEAKAEAQRKQEAENIKAYWTNVNNIINNRTIAGYKIPETFTKEVDGKKVVLTPNDFLDYVSKASVKDSNGNNLTQYQADLNKLTDDEYLNREMLDAWLMFTGGTYKDLIDMAVKENEVRKLIVKSKQIRSNKSVKVVKKQTGKTNIDDIVF